MANRAALFDECVTISEDFPQVFRRIEDLQPRIGAPPSKVELQSRSTLSTPLPLPSASRTKRNPLSSGKYSCGAGVFGNDWTAHRQKRRGAIAQPTGPPSHIHTFDRGKFAQRTGEILPILPGVRATRWGSTIRQPRSCSRARSGSSASDIHRQFKRRFRDASRQIEIFLERNFFDRSGNCPSTSTAPSQYHCPMVVNFDQRRPRLRPNKARIGEGIKSLPLKRSRFSARRQSRPSNIKPDRPELVMIRLAHLQLASSSKKSRSDRDRRKSCARMQQKRRMNRVTQIQQRVRSGQAIKQFAFRDSDAMHRIEIVLIACRSLMRANNIVRRGHVHAFAAENCRSWLYLHARYHSPARARAKSRRASAA